MKPVAAYLTIIREYCKETASGASETNNGKESEDAKCVSCFALSVMPKIYLDISKVQLRPTKNVLPGPSNSSNLTVEYCRLQELVCFHTVLVRTSSK